MNTIGASTRRREPYAYHQTVLFSRIASPPVGVLRAIAVVNVVAQAGIAVTGSIVRVTESGLGCPTWPYCQAGSLVPIADPTSGRVHEWIEFSNRLLGGAVGVCSALVLLGTLLVRPQRRRVIWLALTMPAGVVLQALLGGLTVRTQLTWWTVSLHFLPSPVLVWLAVLLVRAINEGDEPARPLIPRPLRALEALMAGVVGLVVVAGTLVTGAGPHAGDPRTPRLDLPVADLAQAHADVVYLFVGMLVALGFALRITGGHAVLWRRYWTLAGIVVAQAALGMIQYWLGVPDVLVIFHVLGATLVVAAMAAVWCESRDRGPRPTGTTAATACPVDLVGSGGHERVP